MTQIYNKHKKVRLYNPIPSDAIYVGRSSKWGNPFRLNSNELPGATLERFRKYAIDRLEREPHWLDELKGKDLICWCQSPSDLIKSPCHAEILIELMVQ